MDSGPAQDSFGPDNNSFVQFGERQGHASGALGPPLQDYGDNGLAPPGMYPFPNFQGPPHFAAPPMPFDYFGPQQAPLPPQFGVMHSPHFRLAPPKGFPGPGFGPRFMPPFSRPPPSSFPRPHGSEHPDDDANGADQQFVSEGDMHGPPFPPPFYPRFPPPMYHPHGLPPPDMFFHPPPHEAYDPPYPDLRGFHPAFPPPFRVPAEPSELPPPITEGASWPPGHPPHSRSRLPPPREPDSHVQPALGHSLRENPLAMPDLAGVIGNGPTVVGAPDPSPSYTPPSTGADPSATTRSRATSRSRAASLASDSPVFHPTTPVSLGPDQVSTDSGGNRQLSSLPPAAAPESEHRKPKSFSAVSDSHTARAPVSTTTVAPVATTAQTHTQPAVTVAASAPASTPAAVLAPALVPTPAPTPAPTASGTPAPSSTPPVAAASANSGTSQNVASTTLKPRKGAKQVRSNAPVVVTSAPHVKASPAVDSEFKSALRPIPMKTSSPPSTAATSSAFPSASQPILNGSAVSHLAQSTLQTKGTFPDDSTADNSRQQQSQQQKQSTARTQQQPQQQQQQQQQHKQQPPQRQRGNASAPQPAAFKYKPSAYLLDQSDKDNNNTNHMHASTTSTSTPTPTLAPARAPTAPAPLAAPSSIPSSALAPGPTSGPVSAQPAPAQLGAPTAQAKAKRGNKNRKKDAVSDGSAPPSATPDSSVVASTKPHAQAQPQAQPPTPPQPQPPAADEIGLLFARTGFAAMNGTATTTPAPVHDKPHLSAKRVNARQQSANTQSAAPVSTTSAAPVNTALLPTPTNGALLPTPVTSFAQQQQQPDRDLYKARDRRAGASSRDVSPPLIASSTPQSAPLLPTTTPTVPVATSNAPTTSESQSNRRPQRGGRNKPVAHEPATTTSPASTSTPVTTAIPTPAPTHASPAPSPESEPRKNARGRGHKAPNASVVEQPASASVSPVSAAVKSPQVSPRPAIVVSSATGAVVSSQRPILNSASPQHSPHAASNSARTIVVASSAVLNGSAVKHQAVPSAAVVPNGNASKPHVVSSAAQAPSNPSSNHRQQRNRRP